MTFLSGVLVWMWRRGGRPLWERRLRALEERERLNAGIQEVVRQFQPNGGSTLFDRFHAMESAIDAIRSAQTKADLRQWCFFSTSERGVFETGADGQVLRISNAYTRWTGRSTDEFIGWGWKEALHPSDEARLIALWADTVRESRRFEETVVFQGPDGNPVPVYTEAVPVMIKGQLIGYFGVGRHVK